jgi:hypothetical protein
VPLHNPRSMIRRILVAASFCHPDVRFTYLLGA